MKSSLPSTNDIVALGELLIDFTESPSAAGTGNKLFEQNPGGAPANMLTAASRQGSKTAFIGKVGGDMHGEFLKNTLISAGIDVSGLVMDENVFTTLAFVALTESGEREFSFARKPGADTCLKPDEINYDLIARSKVFHFGSLSLTDEPAREATEKALVFAKDKGLTITYDPNYRSSLWSSEEKAITMMKKYLSFVDIIKIADNEFPMITGENDLDEGIKHLMELGVKCVVVTLGEKGAYVSTKGEGKIVPVPKMDVVDTTGAGDAFFGGFVSNYLKSGLKLSDIKLSDLEKFAFYGNATAALCVTRRGAIPAMPFLAEVEEFVATQYIKG